MSRISGLKYLQVLIFVPFLLSLIWFRGGLIVGAGEEGLMFYNPTKTLELSKIMLWDYDGGFPTLAWLSKMDSLLPTAFLYEKLHVPNYILQGGTFFILLLVGTVSMYLLTGSLLKSVQIGKKVAFLAAIFYLLNPFSVSQIWSRGLYSQFFSFALLPLAMLLFFNGLLKKKLIYVVYLIFASIVFSSAFGLATFIMTYWTVLTVCLLYWILLNRKNIRNILFGCFFYLFSFFFWIVVHSWWLLPHIIYGSTIYSGKMEGFKENLGTLLGVSNNFTPSVIIRLLQRTYFFDYAAFSTIYSTSIFQLISFLIPTFLIMGFVVIFKIQELRKFKFFILLFILGLVVSLGANPPFGWLFVWIFKQSSLLQSFRNPYEKFGLVYALAYSPIFALGLVYFCERVLKVNKLKVIGLSVVLFLICGIYAWPMWTGKVVSFPNSTPGVDVPKYYQQLNNWLNINNKEGYRVFMTPIWPGDGSSYRWNNTRYAGLDPMIFILDTPAISSMLDIPFYYDFIQNLRRYMERMDVSPSLQLFRARYIIARNDALNLIENDKQHYKYLSESIYPPLGIEMSNRTICQGQSANSKINDVAWLLCEVPSNENNWSRIKYLHLTVKTDVPADLEVAIRDSKQTRVRWDGRVVSEYSTQNNEWTTITIPLNVPTEYNSAIDFSNVYLLEVLAHPKGLPNLSVRDISLQELRLDPGEEKKTGAARLVNTFGNLQVYELLHFNSPPEFGILSSVEQVEDFVQLFEEVGKKRDLINKKGFVLRSQNTKNNLQYLPEENALEVEEKIKINDTRYWLKVKGNGSGLLILSKTFNSGWKVISGIDRNDLNGGFFEDLKIIRKTFSSEQNHYVVNGYANLWRIDGSNNQYAIVFMSQIVADIGLRVSIFSIMLLIGFTLVWQIRKYISSR